MASLPAPNKRQEFTREGLHRLDLLDHPLEQVRVWLQEAVSEQNPDPYAVTLATTQPDGMPAARTVLLKHVDERGFVFTSTKSPKTHDLGAHPYAALVFYWPELERQVRVSGHAEVLSREESAALYEGRPHDQRLALLTFPQSQPILNRAALDKRFESLRREYAGREVEMPEHWGGWRVVPTVIEFWQGGVNRLHDRLRYVRQHNEAWRIERLAP